MIVGIGTDICHSVRIEATDAFANKILSEKEHNIYNIRPNKHRFISNRFAAKEAVSKAFGVGIGATLGFKDISILVNEMGAPYVVISEEAKLNLPDYTNIHITISDEKEYAVAFVIVEQV